MMSSNSLSIPACVLLLTSLTISNPSSGIANNLALSYICHPEAVYETISSNPISQSYAKSLTSDDAKNEALELYGIQSNFTSEEQASYRDMLTKHSKNLGMNMFDLFENRE